MIEGLCDSQRGRAATSQIWPFQVVVYHRYGGKEDVATALNEIINSSGSWFFIKPEGLNHWEAQKYAEADFGESGMKFSLIYQGPLLAKKSGSGSRVTHEHEIRKVIHKQLTELWKSHYRLRVMATARSAQLAAPGIGAQTSLEVLSARHQKGPFRFAPLVCQETGLVCRLDILFLRRSDPGEIVTHGGDLDNRLKTLFDALRIPSEVGELQPQEGENPFYCLLEDDALITEVNVVTDRLLEPISKEQDKNVHLVIRVETFISKVMMWNLP